MKDADFDSLTNNGSAALDGAMSSIVVAKLSSMAVLGITSFFLGILPIKLASCLRWKPSSGAQHVHGKANQPLVISLLLCFGGGVLLYTVFMHLQPEVAEHMDAIVRTGYIPSWITETGLNLAQLVFCLGFFFVYLLEETVHVLLDKGHTEEDMEVLHRSLSLRKGCRGGNLIPRISLAKPGQTPPSTITASTQVLIRDGSYNSKKNVIDPIGNMSPAPTEPSETGSSSLNSDRPTTVGHSLRGFFAVLALSFHAVFEGLAVGLEKETANVWYLCAAIATHKLVIAFCVGVELVSSRTKTVLVVMYMAAFAVVSPLGIGIGLIITSEQVNPNSPAVALPSVVLQGMASGTLLYVVFFEVLQREKGNSKHGFSQLMAIIAGFSVMIALSLFIGHEHSHAHDLMDHFHNHHHHDHHVHLDHDHDHDHDHGELDHT
uniref:Zinc transporter ZIP1 n=1 Tax=Lygus hesperus TaxID=30085 RepID=A0A0A9XI38_LYGHE